MAHTTLIAFLGRVRREERGHYQTTRYVFDDGTDSGDTAFLRYALARRRLRPDRLVILGTTGSMWDHLFESDVPLGASGEALRIELVDAVENRNVEQRLLDGLAPLLTEALGLEVRLTLIPYCKTESEQTDLLEVMAGHVSEGDRLHIDVTHGFRHLPMLALLAGMYLRLARRAQIDGIWYGAFDPDTRQGEVLNLVGLLELADAVNALAAFDAHGDYRVFSPILERTGLERAQLEAFAQAGYFENILNVGEATGKLRQFRGLEGAERGGVSPVVRLLMPLIHQRIAWLEEDRRFDKQLALAERCLERTDYLRATLHAYESLITRVCQNRGAVVSDFTQREEARKAYENELNHSNRAKWRSYRLLKDLRNEVAHGSRGSYVELQKILLSEPDLAETLRRLIDDIRQGRLP